MQVCSVSQNQNFNGSIQRTPAGNEYETSNTGKYAVTSLAAANALLSISFAPKNTPGASKVITLITSAAIGLGFGAIVDHLVNKTRKNDADRFEKTKRVPEKTNKGKMVTTGIGVGMGLIGNALVSAVSKKAGVQKPPAFVTVGLATLTWFIYGLIYDNGINKFREKLAQKAEAKA